MMEPRRAVFARRLAGNEVEYAFDNIDTVEALKGMIDYFAGVGLRVSGWECIVMRDDDSSRNGCRHRFGSEAELLAQLPSDVRACDFELTGTTAAKSRRFLLDVRTQDGSAHLVVANFEPSLAGLDCWEDCEGEYYALDEYPDFR